MKLLLPFLLFLLSTTAVFGQAEVLTIATSAVCEECKERIEHAFAYEKGVEKAELDLETNTLTLNYSSKKTSPERLRARLTEIGYDADEQKAKPKAYGKLPYCCQISNGAHKRD